MTISAGALRALRADVSFKRSVMEELAQTVEKYAAKVSADAPQEEFVTTVAANLARLYTGIEDILEQVLMVFDDFQPTGGNWHSLVLTSSVMASDSRPAVISRRTFSLLDELRGFRHIVYKAYTRPFDWAKMQNLASSIQSLLSAVTEDLGQFDVFLSRAIEVADRPT